MKEETQEDGLVDDVPVQNTNPVELASARQVAHEEYMEEVEAREEHPPLSTTPTAPLGQFMAQLPPPACGPTEQNPQGAPAFTATQEAQDESEGERDTPVKSVPLGDA